MSHDIIDSSAVWSAYALPLMSQIFVVLHIVRCTLVSFFSMFLNAHYSACTHVHAEYATYGILIHILYVCIICVHIHLCLGLFKDSGHPRTRPFLNKQKVE